MRSDEVSDLWSRHSAVLYWRPDNTGTVTGYFLRDGLPLGVDGKPSHRLIKDWRRYHNAGVRWWWRIDGPEEEWRPAGDTARRSGEHVGWHVCAVELSVTDRDVGPCPECARINARAAKTEAA